MTEEELKKKLFADLEDLYKKTCDYLKNMSSEELEERLRKAEEDSKDSYIFDNYDN